MSGEHPQATVVVLRKDDPSTQFCNCVDGSYLGSMILPKYHATIHQTYLEYLKWAAIPGELLPTLGTVHTFDSGRGERLYVCLTSFSLINLLVP